MSSTSPRIDDEGYTIIEDAVEPELVVALRDTIRRLQDELGVEPLGTAAEGHSTLRMYNLLAKDPVFQAMPVHPRAPDRRGVVGPGCLLSGMTAIDIGPGEDAQPMHGDDIVMSRHLARPHAPMMVTSMWALTDFTAENGPPVYWYRCTRARWVTSTAAAPVRWCSASASPRPRTGMPKPAGSHADRS